VTADAFELTGAAAPPLANGELVFDEPWQGRAFGIARSLAERGLYSWDEFRARLIASIAQWERLAQPDGHYRYYDCFLAALESLLVERRLLASGELRERIEHFGTRPHGHDHDHDHDEPRAR
jgi:nitrile hydratase accessory protein